MIHFNFSELVDSPTARSLRIDNVPKRDEFFNLALLVTHCLEPMRVYWDKPIKVNSGYRCPELNRLVKGVPGSQHLTGEAADITTGTVEGNRKLFEWAKTHILFDQLICERGGSWIHISYTNNNRNRMQILET